MVANFLCHLLVCRLIWKRFICSLKVWSWAQQITQEYLKAFSVKIFSSMFMTFRILNDVSKVNQFLFVQVWSNNVLSYISLKLWVYRIAFGIEFDLKWNFFPCDMRLAFRLIQNGKSNSPSILCCKHSRSIRYKFNGIQWICIAVHLTYTAR